MWNNLPSEKRETYKKMILAFASLSELFSQKNEDGELTPIINSKYQETVFKKSFNGVIEDIGNTSFDASIEVIDNDVKIRYLIGIKTFGLDSGYQKIAQFKGYASRFSDVVGSLERNGTKDEINNSNRDKYLAIAKLVSEQRNKRIKSARANAKGFLDANETKTIYHVLMPHKKQPKISVGEISYEEINIDNISISGCSDRNSPLNFNFSDGTHEYKFTIADSQLLMNFDNRNIILETWDVKYSQNPYNDILGILYKEEDSSSEYTEKDSDLLNRVTIFNNVNNENIKESYSWLITNKDGEVEKSSGFNSFYGTGSKLSKEDRKNRIENIIQKYESVINKKDLAYIKKQLTEFLTAELSFETKIKIRDDLLDTIKDNADLKDDVSKLVYRPITEVYIPIPKSREFHEQHPDFFGKGICILNSENKLILPNENRSFNLIFEPSGNKIKCFITQDGGKAIESVDKQSILGQWILRDVFQLGEYQPLTKDVLNEIGINGIRLYKTNSSNDVHLQFVWIDEDNKPDDFIDKK